MSFHRVLHNFRWVALATILSLVNKASAEPVLGTGPQDYTIPFVSVLNPPKIDGKIDPNEWPSTPEGHGFFDKDTGTPSEEEAQFWIASDSKYIYFGARIKTDPKKIVADEYRNGVSLTGNDNITLAIDPFASGNSINSFGVNAAGGTSIQLAGGRAAKTEWLGEIEGSGSITPTGWECEAKVPWGIMNLPASGKKDVKFNILWFRSNKSNTYEWKYTRNDLRNLAIWTDAIVPNIKLDRTLNLLPYAYFGVGENGNLISNMGLDAKTKVNDQLQLVTTVNPDFRNIENNILSLDFSYFERLADDARPFFQEGARFYQTGFDQKLFATQRIKDFDMGVNLYGNLNSGKTKFGLASITDFGNKETAVMSVVQKAAPNYDLGFAYVGNREKSGDNDALQLTNSLKLGDDQYYVNAQFTSDELKKSGHRLSTGWFREAGGLTANIDYSQVSPDFYPRVGFSPEQDLKGISLFAQREWSYQTGSLQSLNSSVEAIYFDHFNDGFYRNQLSLGTNLGFKNGLAVGGSVEFSNFEGSSDSLKVVGMKYPFTNAYRFVKMLYSFGSFGGQSYRSWSIQGDYKPAKRMQVSLAAQYVEFNDFFRQIIGTVRYDLGRFESVGTRFVNRGDNWNIYGFYRFSGRRGNEYFLILGDPNTRTFEKQLMIKVVMPFTIKM